MSGWIDVSPVPVEVAARKWCVESCWQELLESWYGLDGEFGSFQGPYNAKESSKEAGAKQIYVKVKRAQQAVAQTFGAGMSTSPKQLTAIHNAMAQSLRFEAVCSKSRTHMATWLSCWSSLEVGGLRYFYPVGTHGHIICLLHYGKFRRCMTKRLGCGNRYV